VGQVGEIAVRSPQVMSGYWKLPDATGRALHGDWFLTGDAGYLDASGYLYIYDRVKDMIVSGGENIYPAEVESALFAHPAVADVAVIGVPDARWGEAVKAVVVRKAGAEVTPGELIAWARERIAGYKLPKSVDFIDILPRNPTGKILKRELRKPYWEGKERLVN
jgi:long-chain acyl-CoA synthetase